MAKELEGWRQRQYVELVSLLGREPVTGEVQGAAGTRYQYEIEVDQHGVEDLFNGGVVGRLSDRLQHGLLRGHGQVP